MIKLLRIDDRLLHGQVAFSWTKVLSIESIIIVNDEVVKDEITKMTLGIAKPRGTTLVVKGVEDGIAMIKENTKNKKNVMVIVNNVFDAKKIVDEVSDIKSINFGGLKEKIGIPSKRFTSSVTLTNEEIELAKELAERDIELEIRQVPEDKKTQLKGLL